MKRITEIPSVSLIATFLLPLWFLAASVLANSPLPAGPVADSLAKKQRDSVLMAMNLQYLEGIQEKQTPFQLIPILEKMLAIDPGQSQRWFNLGFEYTRIHEFRQAIGAFEKGILLYPESDNGTLLQVYIALSHCYNKTKNHQKEKEILDRAAGIFPDHPGILGRYMICAHSRMRFHEAEQYQEMLRLVLRKKGLNEAEIAYHIGRLYLNVDYLVAEEYFRTAYHYLPDDPEIRGDLAWVLIQNALRIDEGMDLMKKALEMDPQNPRFIHELGYGYYILGEYDSALAKMKTARGLYDEYSFELDNHIRLVEEAMASNDR